MELNECYLCGNLMTDGDRVTSDHVVPVGLLRRKQPKERGYDYAGRIRTHQECNNNFSDETFFKQSIHLAELILNGEAHGVLRNAENPDVTILPTTPDQNTKFATRDFKRFSFIDTRQLTLQQLSAPETYVDKRKKNLSQTATYVAMSVLAKSGAALLVKRKLARVPKAWRIFSAPYRSMSFSDFERRFGTTVPFDEHTWAAIQKRDIDEWIIAYQHKGLLFLFLFVLHRDSVDLKNTFSTPGSEIHYFSGNTLNELLSKQWNFIERIK